MSNKNEFLNKLLDNFKNEWEEFLLNGNKGEMIWQIMKC